MQNLSRAVRVGSRALRRMETFITFLCRVNLPVPTNWKTQILRTQLFALLRRGVCYHLLQALLWRKEKSPNPVVFGFLLQQKEVAQFH
jgi:hypothetical protein